VNPTVRHAEPPQRGGRLVWCLVVLSLVLAVAPASTASGDEDDLKQRKHKVEQRIHAAQDHLEASTRRLQRATRRLGELRDRLDGAREVYRQAHGELVAAALVDDRAQAELDAAEIDLGRAEARVGDATDRILQQEAVLRGYAVDAFQSGDPTLLQLSAVFTSQEPTDLMDRLGSMQTVADRQAGALSRLRAARVVQEVARERLEATRDPVAERRSRAAQTLHARQVTEQSAAQARAQVRDLRDQARVQMEKARKARADDLKRLRKIRKERAHVRRLLRRYYAAERRKARARHRHHRAAHHAPGKAAGMPWPVHGWISSRYGMRLHPVYHRWTLHDGLDLAAPCGRPVRAAANGLVVARYYNVAYGNRVVIGHGLRNGVGLATTYNHLSRFSTHRGQVVHKGEIIGYVGSTGYSTGCHLHFMVLRGGHPVPPGPWLR
jgi:murein DD-endopeptidase MepM/ murein hydrolase activator NlpD